LVIFLTTVGEATGGQLRRLAVFGTHYRLLGRGPNDFPVNHTAAAMGITTVSTGPDWRLSLEGHGRVYLSRQQLLALSLTTASLPIACTEGWSTQQRWTGVPLADLARLAGVANPGRATLKALDGSTVSLSAEQLSASSSLLALRVNGADLSLDHGFPARVIVPAMPGSYNLKWMSHIIFSEEA
jgi:DMSO/TMAO reductase YedYZ molybdopterin-dependent catalytic subunit